MEKRLDRFAWNFQERCRVTTGWPDSILGQFRETAWCRDANFFVSIYQHYEQMAGPICMKFWEVTMGRPYYIFGQFRETALCHDAQHADGVCCAFAPQLVLCYKRSLDCCSMAEPAVPYCDSLPHFCNEYGLMKKRNKIESWCWHIEYCLWQIRLSQSMPQKYTYNNGIFGCGRNTGVIEMIPLVVIFVFGKCRIYIKITSSISN